MRHMIIAMILSLGLILPVAAAEPDRQADTLVRTLLSGTPDERGAALALLRTRGKTDVVPALISALRFVPDFARIEAMLQQLTGAAPEDGWNGWMLWLEDHPEIEPFDGFDSFKADFYARIDENFRLFLEPGAPRTIRLEEIVWGGVVKDGIPALVDAQQIPPSEARYLNDDDPVFGVALNGDARAYPLRIMDWHEMANDIVGGVPVALAYCTLCGSAILYETLVAPRARRFVFGSSGFLYRSNKLMYDHTTHSLWHQFVGKPVVGRLVGSGIVLNVRPVAITRWKDWRDRHPETTVLSLETGYRRDYRPGAAYGTYFASPELMFPAQVRDDRLAPKDQVFVLRLAGREKAWPIADFAGGTVVNDDAGGLDVVLVGDAASRTVRAYAAGGQDFTAAKVPFTLTDTAGGEWRVEEEQLVGPDGQSLDRLPGHIAYWFAWSGFGPR